MLYIGVVSTPVVIEDSNAAPLEAFIIEDVKLLVPRGNDDFEALHLLSVNKQVQEEG